MLCPKCYGKVGKNQKRCATCGFDISKLESASNKQAKKALKSIYKDNVLYLKGIPNDVSKKKLLLLSIFLGMFGAHDFYVGKLWNGIFKLASATLTSVLGLLVLSLGIIVQNNAIYIAFQFSLVFQGLNVIFWIADIVKIFLERYKVPVYDDSFSKE